MSEAPQNPRIGAGADPLLVRRLGVFAAWRLQAYGYTLAAAYAAMFFYVYKTGIWLLDGNGLPVYQDFACAYAAGLEALHGATASIYIPAEFARMQEALVGAGHARFSLWPYPPIYFLILAPLAILPYVVAFLTWILTTLLGCIVVVYMIVRQPPAIALVLTSPFAVANVLAGQSGFLTASLIGAALLTLERQPVLAGVLIGCLTFKPQWGILIPVALVAAGEWRAIASAAGTTVILAGASVAAFGIDAWAAFPRELVAQAHLNLFAPSSRWGLAQSVYGLIRFLHGGATVAWLAQGMTTFATAVIVWLVWRSRARYALKAAALSAAALLATPYAFPYDLTAIAVPVAFLAKDQLDRGLLRGEQTMLLVLFAASLSIVVMVGKAPGGAPILLALLSLILRRLRHARRAAAGFA
jgi:arabinofuranan 3-O-arabinosyltransferase